MNQPQALIIQVTIDGVNTILRALDKLPHIEVRPLFDDIVQQAQNQVKPLEQTPVSVDPAEEVE
ncbi:hypothetical protein UFOVP14_45 [uncultured Caudovirales phage]|uniref:Uncharacterized protein n=1 Tax=uncultured Caudovirales phage TaxID=2100421 RepID=A0A6J5KHS6_9CAUD|nr:hypothetical protein UFOVP14_45 [uncultured Caudovirales phage]